MSINALVTRTVESGGRCDPHPHTHTATHNHSYPDANKQRYSVLTVAGWCGVSNLIKQDVANSSWVCVWKVSQDTSVLVKAWPREEGRGIGATLTAASWPQMAAD